MRPYEKDKLLKECWLQYRRHPHRKAAGAHWDDDTAKAAIEASVEALEEFLSDKINEIASFIDEQITGIERSSQREMSLDALSAFQVMKQKLAAYM